MILLAIFSVLVFAYSLLSRRLEETPFTAPMLFAIAGAVAATIAPVSATAGVNPKIFLHLAETGLVLLLFTEAGRTDLSQVWNIRELPARLLCIGLPLTIAAGIVAALLVFPQLEFWEAAILAAILAPTDAGLGQVVVSSPKLPSRLRQALNVEAGLNDGLVVPFLLFFMALAARQEGDHHGFGQYVVEQLGYGTAIGVVVGLFGGWMLGWSARREWISGPWSQAGVFALPVLCLISSEELGASMFIAAFVGGVAVQFRSGNATTHGLEFGEIAGQVLNLLVFFLFGMVVAREWRDLDWAVAAYAVLSLTVVRILPVAIAMLGKRLGWRTTLLLGWFGPRGLASIVLGLVLLQEEMHLTHEATLRAAIIGTVLFSIFAHGLSARPGVAAYARSGEGTAR